MADRAEASRSLGQAWTVDSRCGGKRIAHAQAQCRHRAFCGACHTLNPDDWGLALPGFLGSAINPYGKPMTTTPTVGAPQHDGPILTRDYVGRLKDATSMKVVLNSKALALWATAVGVRRPYILGLAAFGQPGVETVLDILDSELRRVQAGVSSLGRITKSYVRDRRPPAW